MPTTPRAYWSAVAQRRSLPRSPSTVLRKATTMAVPSEPTLSAHCSHSMVMGARPRRPTLGATSAWWSTSRSDATVPGSPTPVSSSFNVGFASTWVSSSSSFDGGVVPHALAP